MLRLILVSVICLQLVRCYDRPGTSGSGAFAYLDSSGKRYGGTYGLRDGEVVDVQGDLPPQFPTNYIEPYFDNYFPLYFRNLENILQETFRSNLEYQWLAFDAAKKALDLTSNQAGYIAHLQSRFGPPEYQDYSGFNQYNYEPMAGPHGIPPFGMNFGMPPLPENGAFASAAVGPTYRHQIAAINPPNPNNANVNEVEQYPDRQGPGQYVSVSSSSYSSSSNVDGKTKTYKGAETIVNKNGKVTKYKVEN